MNDVRIKACLVEYISPPTGVISGIPCSTFYYQLDRPLKYVDVHKPHVSGETSTLCMYFAVVAPFGNWWHQISVSGGASIIHNYYDIYQGTPGLVMAQIGCEVT